MNMIRRQPNQVRDETVYKVENNAADRPQLPGTPYDQQRAISIAFAGDDARQDRRHGGQLRAIDRQVAAGEGGLPLGFNICHEAHSFGLVRFYGHR